LDAAPTTRHGAINGGAPSLPRAALEICAGIIRGPIPAATDLPGRDTLLTTRWVHPELHAEIPALPVHTIGTYHGVPAARIWRCGGERFAGTGQDGGIAIVPAEWSGYWDIEGNSALSYVLLSDLYLQRLATPLSGGRRVELVPRVAEPDPVGAHILQALAHEAAHPDPAGRLFVEQALDLLGTHLIRAHSSLGKAGPPVFRGGLPPWKVRRVDAYIAEHLDESIGLDELADLTALSRSHFCTAFRHATGLTPHEWLTRKRMEKAGSLLRNHHLSVTEIALAVGYQTPSAFAAAFRREVGTSPSRYRRCIA
jgi:AraC family transcriptional regulator